MGSIKGLIAKDLANLSHYKRTLIIVIIIFGGISFYQSDFHTVLPIMLTTMIGMIGLSVFSYDEIAKSDKYMLTLPTNRKEMVKAKYILIIGLTALGSIIGAVFSYLAFWILNQQTPDLMQIMVTSLAGFMGIAIVESVQIPSIYKWGAERGRIQMFIMIVVVMAIIGGLLYLISQQIGDFDTTGIITALQRYGVVFMVAIMIVSYLASYRVSLKIYNKKEI